jgi:adenosylcobinamide-GDP ribazoletransferase
MTIPDEHHHSILQDFRDLAEKTRKSFLLAVQFLTIFPYPRNLSIQERDLGRSMGQFSAVGAILGFILYLVDWLLANHLPIDLIDILLLIILTVLTGGLHLDGLADTMDGVGGIRRQSERLAIMKDSRLGTFGASGLIFLLLLDLTALHHLGEHRGTYIFLAPLLSRFSMVISALTQPYARREDGLGRSFIEEVSLQDLALAGGIALVACLILLGTKGLILFCLVSGLTLLLGNYFRYRLGGITGDSLGANNELMMALVWFFGCIR